MVFSKYWKGWKDGTEGLMQGNMEYNNDVKLTTAMIKHQGSKYQAYNAGLGNFFQPEGHIPVWATFWGPHDSGRWGQRQRWAEQQMFLLLYGRLVFTHTSLSILHPSQKHYPSSSECTSWAKTLRVQAEVVWPGGSLRARQKGCISPLGLSLTIRNAEAIALECATHAKIFWANAVHHPLQSVLSSLPLISPPALQRDTHTSLFQGILDTV